MVEINYLIFHTCDRVNVFSRVQMEDIGVWAAFIGGILSFASPCVLPLVPPYLSFLAGMTLDQITDENADRASIRHVFFNALAFVLGFAAVFVAMGATASFTGKLLALYARPLAILAGFSILIMGLHFLGLFRIGLLYREARVHVDEKPVGLFGAFVIGLAFAFGWTPCVGPVLAALLFVAGAEESVWEGAILLGSYAAGIGIPFLAAAMFARPFMQLMTRFRRHIGKVERIVGGLLVVTGLLFITGGINDIGFWLLETFPVLGKRG
jgi:cytochrome c-type biogenesis protein